MALADQAVLIGGGYDLHSTQAQIEKNVQWARDSLESVGVSTTVYFSDGDDPADDVFYLATDEEYHSPFEAMSRVYGEHTANRLRYRGHSLENVAGATNAEALKNNLAQILNEAEQSTLLVFNGHGSSSHDAPHQVGISLWGNTSIKADELQSVVRNATQPLRYVFTQCYSGGFNSMVFANPAEGLELSKQHICGVTSVSPYRKSEGCSAQVSTNGYRDYTTYFFAALSGYDQKGEILSRETDMDKDGLVSLREAHMYSVETAVSTDIAYSSSDFYLERWEPWYLKWLPARRSLPNNEFAKIFRSLATKHNMPLEGNAAKTIRSALRDATENSEKLSELYHEIQEEEHKQQQEIQLAVEAKWPALGQPYTDAFKTLVSGENVAQISHWISQHSVYAKLLALQTRSSNLSNDILEAERYATQLQKMLHMRKLASLKQQLYQYGSFEEVAGYERLLMCEKAPLSQ
ncbi:MAG: hypothetical protein V3U65_10605 [Granulosicoccaceae bacterium]